MDPNEALLCIKRRLANIEAEWDKRDDDAPGLSNLEWNALQLAEHLGGLLTWLERGGFAPDWGAK